MRPVVAILGVLVGGLVAASPAVIFADEPVEIANWTAPPYWSPRASTTLEQRPEDQGADLHRRSTQARGALVSGSTALPFIAILPCRLVDTRGNGAPLTGGFLPSATIRSYTLTGVCNVPANAQAISLNATVVKPTGPGFLTIWPEGGTFPPVSTLNYLGNDVIVNAALVPLSATGGISIALGVSGGDVILDTNGYYAPQTLVSTLNTLSGDLTLAQGSNVTITPSGGNTLTIAATSGVTSITGTNHLSASPSTGAVTVTSDATFSNTASTIVSRDGSGNFSAGTITATLTGSASANVLKAGDTMTGTLTLNPGNINLVTDPSTAASGSIFKNGSRFIHDAGYANSENTFVGLNAGNFNMTFAATANTALGYAALSSNTTGSANTASGVGALWLNTTGYSSSAFGHGALYSNTTGAFNAAFGKSALANNTTGLFNSAFGNEALPINTTGGNNAAFGSGALLSNTTGDSNLAVGTSALYQSTGSANIALGTNAGFNLTSGSNNIDIGNSGIAGESGAIRIGTVGTHIATFIAGINGVTSSGGVTVYVNGAGQLGTLTSSRRFKRDIRDMAESSGGLLQLRPVSFRYREELDPTGLEQYGLIAEEVAEVYPDLVVYDADGQPQTVRYHFLVPMLLNEVQKQRRTVDTLRDDAQGQSRAIERQSRSIDQLRGEIEALKQALTSVGWRAE